MTARDSFSADDQRLIARIEATGAELDTQPRGWGFFHVPDEGLKLLKRLSGVQFLDLFEACEAGDVSDDGLAHLARLKSLACLRLGPGISDDGLAHLRGLTSLAELWLDSAEDVSDEGLQAVQGLTSLEELSLQYTGITDAGMPHLSQLSRLVKLTLDGTPISDAGLQHLHGLKALRQLSLNKTEVTQEGVSALQSALPECKVEWDGPKAGAGKGGKQAGSKKPPAATGSAIRLRKTLKLGGSGQVSRVAFSPDGTRLAATGMERGAIWDLTSEDKPLPLKCRRGVFADVVFTADGQTLIALTNSGIIRRLDATTAKDLKTLESDTKWYNALAISPDGSLLAAAGAEGQVFLWDLAEPRQVGVLQAGNIIPEIEVSKDDSFADAQRKFKENQSRSLASHVVGSVAFSPDGKSLALCGRNLDPSIWDIAVRQAVLSTKGHQPAAAKRSCGLPGCVSAPTADCWPRADPMPRSACGTSPPDSRGACWKDIPDPSRTWRSTPAASGWRPSAVSISMEATRQGTTCGYGTWRPSRRLPSSRPRSATCASSRSVPTASRSSPTARGAASCCWSGPEWLAPSRHANR